MWFRNDSHAKLFIRTKLGELITDCRHLNFDKDEWVCRSCGKFFISGHTEGCPVNLLEEAYHKLKDV